MRLMVFPEALRPHVEAVVAEALGRGPEALTVTIVHLPTTKDWSVHATGLGDPLHERSLCDVVLEALRRTPNQG